jgi:hypothetical protein
MNSDFVVVFFLTKRLIDPALSGAGSIKRVIEEQQYKSSKLVGDSCSREKLFKLNRGRYSEQFEGCI